MPVSWSLKGSVKSNVQIKIRKLCIKKAMREKPPSAQTQHCTNPKSNCAIYFPSFILIHKQVNHIQKKINKKLRLRWISTL